MDPKAVALVFTIVGVALTIGVFSFVSFAPAQDSSLEACYANPGRPMPAKTPDGRKFTITCAYE